MDKAWRLRRLAPTVAFAIVVLASGCSTSVDSGAISSTSAAGATANTEDEVAPEVDEIRRMVACLTERGVATEVEPNESGFQADPGALDQEQFMVIIEECKELTGLGSSPPVQLSVDEIRAIYERWIETAACLRSEGYESHEPTSVEAFVDAYPTGEAWNPYLSIQTESTEEFDRLNQICPQ